MSGVSRLVNSYKTSENQVDKVTEALSGNIQAQAENINSICPPANSNLSKTPKKKNGSNALMA